MRPYTIRSFEHGKRLVQSLLNLSHWALNFVFIIFVGMCHGPPFPTHLIYLPDT